MLGKTQKNNNKIDLNIQNIGSSTLTIDAARVNSIEETTQDETMLRTFYGFIIYVVSELGIAQLTIKGVSVGLYVATPET